MRTADPMRRALAPLVVTVFVTMTFAWHSARALDIDYDPERPDALLDCDQQRYRGHGEEAARCYEALLDQDQPLVRAEALVALGRNGDANRVFREAAADPRDAPIRAAWARLYLATHQVSDAEALYREALVIDPDNLQAEIGLAVATAQSFEARAREALQDIVEREPSAVAALLELARIELELQNIDAGRALLNRALVETRVQGLPPLEIHALRAGAALLEDEPIEPHVRAALAWNPGYGDAYAIAAHFYIITYRYREAVDLYRRAVALDPTLASAQRDLGINLLRLDELFGARHHLQLAYALDPFDSRTVNTLKLIDALDDMRISAIDVYPQDKDGEAPIGRALIRLDREDADALEPYVYDLVTRAIRTFSERYDFRLQKPMIVELYHDHDDFGVRTVSTPGIGLLGVTFGYLTAMDSPKARAAGDFHWGSTLWHEIAHVFTIEATNHRLPRWFSEGLSVYEEWSTGPLADRELPLDTLAAIGRDQLLPIEELDAGFVRPSYQGQVQVSYMQAGLICRFIASRWGHQALVTMLKAFARMKSTGEALREATGMDGKTFDAEFAEWLNIGYGDLVASLEEYTSIVRQLDRALSMNDPVGVEALARDVIRRYPERVGPGNAYEILATAQRDQGDDAAAIETLLEWQARGGHAPATLVALADELLELDRDEDAARVHEALNWVMPYNRAAHLALGDHYLAAGDPDRASREFAALLGLDRDDPATARLGLARAALARGERTRARRDVLRSLEAAPFYRPAQRLLLELIEDDDSD